ncbi:PH domain-containing protein [Parasediminibacterium paludis]|uniref:PH domain-containing protein n=1 Tax=Parasediminibacterium paludis TaxID=908966 RepID=A0ABV8Q0K4_9BACT
MALTEIVSGLPMEVTYQLMDTEKVYYFSFIAFKGGCGSSGQHQNYWLALTDRRVMYKTKVSELKGKLENFVEKDGDLPFDKISFIEVSEGQEVKGCSAQKTFQLRISTSGGTIAIPIPTKEKGYEIRKIYSELSHKA